MPNLAPDCSLAYIVNHEAWYTLDDKPSLQVQSASTGGGVDWEFSVHDSGFRGRSSIHIMVFDDAFKAFAQVPELFALLAELEPTSIQTVIMILDQLGAVDVTQRVNPYTRT